MRPAIVNRSILPAFFTGLILFPLFVFAGFAFLDCAKARPEVVVYTALDQIYSEPILNRFQAQTGITVRPVYDSEAAKTTGLVSRLEAERERARCDVFWNNEIVRTIRLKH